MFEMTVSLSDDRAECIFAGPSITAPAKLAAGQLDEIIRQLAWVRASMLPAHEPVDLTPETLVSSVPAIRWQATEDTLPEQSRLHLLHPGFGWIWIPLDRSTFDLLSARTRLFLQPRSRAH
jgi:hypothetical protein